ncbi:MAG: hypothetical protein MUE68_07425 [Bacteroidetes bacterium]|nr:hypothetical protein [Bacteroidota bacterium]
MTDRIFGITFLLLGSLGYICIAEDPRHFYEIVGVSAVFVAGALLTVSGFHWLAVRPIMARSIAAGLILGIAVGAAMSDIPNGVAVGLALGAVLGAAIVRIRQRAGSSSGDPRSTTGPHS